MYPIIHQSHPAGSASCGLRGPCLSQSDHLLFIISQNNIWRGEFDHAATFPCREKSVPLHLQVELPRTSPFACWRSAVYFRGSHMCWMPAVSQVLPTPRCTWTSWYCIWWREKTALAGAEVATAPSKPILPLTQAEESRGERRLTVLPVSS